MLRYIRLGIYVSFQRRQRLYRVAMQDLAEGVLVLVLLLGNVAAEVMVMRFKVMALAGSIPRQSGWRAKGEGGPGSGGCTVKGFQAAKAEGRAPSSGLPFLPSLYLESALRAPLGTFSTFACVGGLCWRG